MEYHDMKNRSQRLTLTVLSLMLFLQSCSFAKKNECKTLVNQVNQINTTWKKVAQLKPLGGSNQKPKNAAELNHLIKETTQPIIQAIQEVDPLLDKLDQLNISDKTIAVYRNNLLFLHVKRSNILRQGVNSLGEFSPGTLTQLTLRSGGSMSETLEAPSSNNEEPQKTKLKLDKVPPMIDVFGGPDPARARRERAARMNKLAAALEFIRNMKNQEEETVIPDEIRVMRRVSATCDIPMPKVESGSPSPSP
jgi:hypothetical protein